KAFTTLESSPLSLHDALPISIISSIIANSGSGATDCSSSIINSGTTSVTGNNSLIENNNACGSPALSSDPMLGPLQNNGGLTFRSEEHTSELQSRFDLVCRLL